MGVYHPAIVPADIPARHWEKKHTLINTTAFWTMRSPQTLHRKV